MNVQVIESSIKRLNRSIHFQFVFKKNKQEKYNEPCKICFSIFFKVYQYMHGWSDINALWFCFFKVCWLGPKFKARWKKNSKCVNNLQRCVEIIIHDNLLYSVVVPILFSLFIKKNIHCNHKLIARTIHIRTVTLTNYRWVYAFWTGRRQL